MCRPKSSRLRQKHRIHDVNHGLAGWHIGGGDCGAAGDADDADGAALKADGQVAALKRFKALLALQLRRAQCSALDNMILKHRLQQRLSDKARSAKT